MFRVGDFRRDDFGTDYDVILASLSLHHAPVVERAALWPPVCTRVSPPAAS
jgi:hypothetical protein